MARSDLWKRYLDAGMEFTQMSRERAEAVVRDLVKAGEVRRKEAEQWVEDLLDRSRRNTEEVVALVRRELREQLENVGMTDAARRIGGPRPSTEPATRATERPATVPTSTAKKSPAKKSPAEKTGAKKTAAKEAPKKTGAKKTAAKKAAAKKSAKKTAAKKSTKKAT